MARARGNRFQADAFVDGKRVRKSFKTLAEAEAFERNAERGLPVEGGLTFKKFHEDSFAFLWGESKAPKAIQSSLASLDKFIPADKLVSEINNAYVMDLVTRMKASNVSNATINRRLSALSKLLRHAELMDIGRRPVINFLKEPQGRDRVLSPEEERKSFLFFDHLGLTDSGNLFKFLLYTGCRLGEAYSLRRSLVENRRATFHWTVTKTSKTRVVPLVGPAWDAWEAICTRSKLEQPFKVLTENRFREHWARLKGHLGVTDEDDFIPHMLRHTCATRLVSKGVPLPQVMLWLGHRNIQTTMRYSHLAPKDLDVAARALMGETV